MRWKQVRIKKPRVPLPTFRDASFPLGQFCGRRRVEEAVIAYRAGLRPIVYCLKKVCGIECICISRQRSQVGVFRSTRLVLRP